MKKLSIHAFILFVILFAPIFVNAEVKNVTVYGSVHQGDLEKQILDAVNEQRREAGKEELQMDMRLTEAARQRAIEIGTYYDSRHLRTNLGAASTIMDDFGIFYYSFGENIAAGYSNVSTVMNAWITSTPHYNNIVNSRYSAIGIGVYQSVDGKWFWVQNFSDSLNNVYTPDTTRTVVGDYSVRYEDSIRSDYSADSLSDVILNVGESHTIDFHITTYNEVTNSSIPLYLSDWESSNSDVCELDTVNQKVVVHAKSAGVSTIHSTFGGVDYSFTITVNEQEEEPIVKNPRIEVITNHNSNAVQLDVDSTKDYTTLKFSVDSVSHNNITQYYEDHSIANPSALDVIFCEDDECNQPIRPVRYQSEDSKIIDYVDGSFIFQNSGQTTITAIFENGIQVLIPVEVSDYHFDCMEYHIFVGDTKKIQLSNDTDLTSTYSVLDEEIININEQGNITGIKSGTAIIQALREDGTLARAKVVVYDKQDLSINVDRENVELKEDESLTLNVSSNLSGTIFTYDGFDSTIIDWKEDGTLTGKKVGSTTLRICATYKVADGLVLKDVKEISITVSKKGIDVADIQLDTEKIELEEGQDVNLVVEVIPSNATNKELTWKSNDTNIVVVDSNGKASAVAAGETVITVTASNGLYKEIKVIVTALERKTIQVDKTHIELNVGETEKVQVTNYIGNLTWRSDNESIAQVDSDGTIHAIGKGTTIIHVMDQENDVEISVFVKEIIPIQQIQVSFEEATLYEGETTLIDVIILPENTTDKLDLVWISNDNNVASVDKMGVVTAISAGEADIIIKSVNGVQSMVHINVVKKLIPISDLEVLDEKITLVEGDSTTLKVKILPEDTTDDVTLNYQSSNENIVSVNSQGFVTAIAEGQATVMVTSSNGISKTISIIVSKKIIPITDITVNHNSLFMTIGDVSRVNANVVPGDTTDDKKLSWSSSDVRVAVVDSNGIVRAIGEGNAILTVHSVNGISKKISVTVSKKTIKKTITKIIKNEFYVDFSTNPFLIENENGKVVLQLSEKDNSSHIQINKNEKLLAVYEISYLEGSNSTFENPKYLVSIPFKVANDKYEKIYVASIVNGKAQSVFHSEIVDGKIHFTTDHFSEYAVFGVLKKHDKVQPSPSSTPSPKTDTVKSDNPKTSKPIIVYIVIWIVAFLILLRMINLLFKKYKKNDV